MPKWQGAGWAPLIPWVKSCSLGSAPRYRARRQLLSPRSVSGCPVGVPLVTVVLGGRGFLGDFSAAAGKLLFFFFAAQTPGVERFWGRGRGGQRERRRWRRYS